MKMKTLALLTVSLAVALALPALPPGVERPVLTEEKQRPLLGDLVPVQGHVEVENPAPQAVLPSKEQQEKGAEVDVKQNMVELELKVKSEGEQEVKPEPEAEEEKAGVVELEVKVKPEVKVEENSEAQQEVKAEPEVPVEVEPNAEVNAEDGVNPEGEGDQELKDDPDFKVESEVKVELDVQMEPEPEEKHMLDEENFQEQMHLVADPGLEEEEEERHDDMEVKNEMVDEPVMELEPLDDDSLFGDEVSKSELTEEEMSVNAGFQSQDPVNEPVPEDEEVKNEMVDEPVMELEPLDDDNLFEPLPEEEEGLLRKKDYMLDEEPIMEMEPETIEEPFHNAGILEEGPTLDIMEQPISLSENYFPNEEAKMGMRLKEQEDSLTGDEESLVQLYKEPGTEDQPVLAGDDPTGAVSEGENQALMGDGATALHLGHHHHHCLTLCLSRQNKQGQSSCPGVVLEDKCYQFFKEPKRAENAELFCQEKFSGGHLASITSQYIHSELMKMILKENGSYTRTWIGGLRFLKTGRFIWLDGSKWDYADWLSGEPNNTSDVENCLEVLPHGNGKFNDFTCWEPQAFICSYYY